MVIQVHALPDTAAALQSLLGPRQKIGFRLLHQPTSMLLQDGGGDLCLKIVACGAGWSLRPRKGQQELEFGQVWAGDSAELFFPLGLEQKDPGVHQINVDFTVFQKMRRDKAQVGGTTEIIILTMLTKQVVEMEVDFSSLSSSPLCSTKETHHRSSKETFHSSRTSVSKESNQGHSSRTNLSKDPNLGHTSRTSANSATSACSSLVASSSGCSSLPASPLQVLVLLTFLAKTLTFQAFKLPTEVRTALCSALDQEQVTIRHHHHHHEDLMANISCSGLWRRLAIVSGRSEAWATSRFLSTSTQSHRLPSQVGGLIYYWLL